MSVDALKIALHDKEMWIQPLTNDEINQVIDGADLKLGEELNLVDFAKEVEMAVIDKLLKTNS